MEKNCHDYAREPGSIARLLLGRTLRLVKDLGKDLLVSGVELGDETREDSCAVLPRVQQTSHTPRGHRVSDILRQAGHGVRERLATAFARQSALAVQTGQRRHHGGVRRLTTESALHLPRS